MQKKVTRVIIVFQTLITILACAHLTANNTILTFYFQTHQALIAASNSIAYCIHSDRLHFLGLFMIATTKKDAPSSAE